MPKDTKTLGNSKARACESLGFVHKKGCARVLTQPLSLSDKERMDVVDRCYNSVRQYRNLVGYYTNKNIAVSYLRSKKKGDTNRVLALYGDTNDRYW